MKIRIVAAALAGLGLAGCGQDSGAAGTGEGSVAAPIEQSVSEARLVATPTAIDLDPCALMDAAALRELEITQVVQVARSAGAESIYNTGTKGPFVGCSWSSPGGVPSMHLRVYHAPDVAMPEFGATPVDAGDGAWLAEVGGRVRLFVKSGDRLIRVSPQAPEFYGADDATYLTGIYQGIAARLADPAANLASAGELPDPQSVCSALDTVPSRQIFYGEVLALPFQHRVLADSAADAEWGNYSGCLWTDPRNNRNSVRARFLDETAHRYEEKSASADWQEATIAGRPARFARDTYLVEMEGGRVLAISSGSMPRGNDLEEAATNIVQALAS